MVDGANYDWDFYLHQNPDVAASGVDPREHYFKFGRKEGRIAVVPEAVVEGAAEADVADYDWDFYLQQYPDIAAAGIDPAKHYFQFGRNEDALRCFRRSTSLALQRQILTPPAKQSWW